MVNPYFCYSISFIAALLVYLLGWSDACLPLTASLLIFLLTTLILSSYAGYRLMKRGVIRFHTLAFDNSFSPVIVTGFIYLLWIIEFFYEGGIPLFKMLLKLPYDYRQFGVPSLHVFIVTFSSFYTIYLFHLFLSSRKKEILFLYLLNLVAAILIYSRAMFFFNLAASFFLFLLTIKRFPGILFIILPIFLAVLFYFFGVLGTLRVSREGGTGYDNKLFMTTGRASESFKKSIIPKEYFWTYMYMASPIANLQYNVHNFKVYELTPMRTAEMINSEIMMDFISKRVHTILPLQHISEYTIPPFNVSTIFSRSFSYLGWTGMGIMTVVILLLPWLYFKIFPTNSPFFLSGLVILCTMYLFMAYDNTIRFTGLSFQLVYPVMLHYGVQKFPLLERFFVNNKVTG